MPAYMTIATHTPLSGADALREYVRWTEVTRRRPPVTGHPSLPWPPTTSIRELREGAVLTEFARRAISRK
ncbi:MAG TPA: hypothetical protein VEB64_07195 [Azospirillaceae bacterium]|nr:hypothetical protein [Azospirillaceae bacterium]